MNLIFDVGYNIGEFAAASFKMFPGVRVIGIEANPRLVYGWRALFRRLLFILKGHRLTVVNCLLDSEAGRSVKFYISDSSSGLSTASETQKNSSRFALGSKYLEPATSRWNRTLILETGTLDAMILKFGVPDLIKIDVEGYEWEVLQGLSTRSAAVCFEWHEESHDSTLKCLSRLASIGFREYGVVGYFEQGPADGVLHSELGGPHLLFPLVFHDISVDVLGSHCDITRRINWGMIYVR